MVRKHQLPRTVMHGFVKKGIRHVRWQIAKILLVANYVRIKASIGRTNQGCIRFVYLVSLF